jgi:hypothetical protein
MYWVAAAIDLILLWSGNDGKASDLPFFIIGIPLAIAVYLWGLTWYFHRQAIAEEMQKQVRNQLDIGS